MTNSKRPSHHTPSTPPALKKQQIVVDPIESGLHDLQARPPLTKYLQQLYEKRHFIFAHAKSQSLRFDDDAKLGPLWLFLNPLLQVSVYALVFGIILKVSRGMENYIGFLTIGVVFFGMLSRGLTQGNSLIRSSRNLMAAFSFPRACLVLSTAIKQTIDDLAPGCIAIAAALLFQVGSFPGWRLVLTIPLFFLLHCFTCGLTFISARLTAFIPDLKSIINTIQRGLFFFSGVFFDVSRFADTAILRELMLANPFYQFLTAFRNCVLDGSPTPGAVWFSLAAWSFGTLIVGFLFFWSAEERYASIT